VSFFRLLAKPVIFISAVASTACAAGPAFGPSVSGLSTSGDSSTVPASLLDCPASPNCVSSLATADDKAVAVFSVTGNDAAAYQSQLVAVIETDGGVVREQRDGYVWATYTSTVFRFVDDIEWLLDANNNHFHVRSASRTGYSDFGVNRKRVERVRAAMTK